MRIVMFSINPLFPDYVMGGAPKHLKNIALYLGELGHQVDVLCTRVEQSKTPFHWQENVQVYPILSFHQPFPQPYATPAYNLAACIQDVADQLKDADRFYMHDGEFLFPYVYDHIPTVISLRDNVYPETLIGSFLFKRDRLILISEYSRRYFVQTVGRFLPDLGHRIDVIHNGVDWQKFKPTQPQRILDFLPVELLSHPVILHPHRPEESKGIRQTIAVADLLVNQYGLHDLKVLAPRWLDEQTTPDLASFYDVIRHDIYSRGLDDNFIFHDWIPQELMPEYYSLGSVTLSLGSFVESFGNAVYESLGCGTPSIVARISTHRELLPEDLIDKVDYGDIEMAAEKAARIIRNQERSSPATLDYLYQHYSVERQLDAYARVILSTQRVPELTYRHNAINKAIRYQLPVWCYETKRGIYHDFLADYVSAQVLSNLFENYPQGFTTAEARSAGLAEAEVLNFYREGLLIPV